MEKIDSKTNRRQVELMKRRFDVDEEKKIVKMDVYYDVADDVLDANLDTKVPSFNREKFGRIKELISDFPNEYKVDLNIKIDDYQNYKPEEIMDGFNDAVELTHYTGNKEHKKKWIQITFLLIAGIMLLNIMARGVLTNWLGLSENGTNVFKEVFDITSWVFIWEAVSLLFLSPSETRVISLTLAHRLGQVSLLDKNGKVLVSEDYRESYISTAKEKELRSVGKYMLLITGAAFLGLAINNIIGMIIDLPTFFDTSEVDPEGMPIFIAIAVIATIISGAAAIFEALGGLAAISAFTGKVGRLYRLVLPFGIIVFAVTTLDVVYGAMNNSSVVAGVIGLIISIIYIVGAIFLMVTKDKEPAK